MNKHKIYVQYQPNTHVAQKYTMHSSIVVVLRS